MAGVQPKQAAGPMRMGSDLDLPGTCQLLQNTVHTRACCNADKHKPGGALHLTVQVASLLAALSSALSQQQLSRSMPAPGNATRAMLVPGVWPQKAMRI